jgi:hypothetical protein
LQHIRLIYLMQTEVEGVPALQLMWTFAGCPVRSRRTFGGVFQVRKRQKARCNTLCCRNLRHWHLNYFRVVPRRCVKIWNKKDGETDDAA